RPQPNLRRRSRPRRVRNRSRWRKRSVPKGLFSLFGGRPASTSSPEAGRAAVAGTHDPAYSTKALGKFIKALQARDNPALIDLGPVVGSNLTFFGEQLGCRIRVEDV